MADHTSEPTAFVAPLGEPSTATPAAPAGETAPASQVSPGDKPAKGMHDLSKTERREFLKTGNIPDKKTDAKTPVPSTGAEIAAKDAPASEPGKPPTDRRSARNSEENRVTELLEDRRRERERADRLEKEIADLRKPKVDAKPDSSPAAAAEPSWKKFATAADAPKIKDFEDIDEWGAAMASYVAERVAKDVSGSVISEREKAAGESAAAEREFASMVDRAATRVTAEETADPTLKGKVDPALRDLIPSRLLPDGVVEGPHHYVKDYISFECEKPLALHAFYSTPEGQAEWESMTGSRAKGLKPMSKAQIQRTIIARELKLESGAAPSAPGVPAPKTFTKAPPPPEKGGPKGAAVVDEADAAVKQGNFKRFKEVMDAKEGVVPRFGRR